MYIRLRRGGDASLLGPAFGILVDNLELAVLVKAFLNSRCHRDRCVVLLVDKDDLINYQLLISCGLLG